MSGDGDHGADLGSSPGWPPPHPSPPLPPPREYGSPGTAPVRRPWLVPALAAAAVAVVVVLVLVLVLGSDDPDRATDPGASSDSAAGTPTPDPATTADPSPSGSTAGSAYTCWDGDAAASLDECGNPEGRAGLEWVFPSLAGQRCVDRPPPAGSGNPDLRILCVDKLPDGTRVQIGYFEWPEVGAGYDYYEGDGLERTDVEDASGEVAAWQWFGAGDTAGKAVAMYAAEPLSVAITVADPERRREVLDTLVAARPVDQLRGVPAG